MTSDRRIYVVSAPSGTGKTTLNRRLVKDHPQIMMSVSYTARKRRPSEHDGIDYHFITTEEFRDRIAKGEMLEYAEVFGTLYGTAKSEIERIQAMGKQPLLEIDVQGWSQARGKLKGAVSVFILPPSVEALWKRLEKRGTEARGIRWKRLLTAKAEISSGHLYDYFLVNASVEDAYQDLQDIVINGKMGKVDNAGGIALCKQLLAEFEQAPWLAKLSAEFADIK